MQIALGPGGAKGQIAQDNAPSAFVDSGKASFADVLAKGHVVDAPKGNEGPARFVEENGEDTGKLETDLFFAPEERFLEVQQTGLPSHSIGRNEEKVDVRSPTSAFEVPEPTDTHAHLKLAMLDQSTSGSLDEWIASRGPLEAKLPLGHHVGHLTESMPKAVGTPSINIDATSVAAVTTTLNANPKSDMANSFDDEWRPPVGTVLANSAADLVGSAEPTSTVKGIDIAEGKNTAKPGRITEEADQKFGTVAATLSQSGRDFILPIDQNPKRPAEEASQKNMAASLSDAKAVRQQKGLLAQQADSTHQPARRSATLRSRAEYNVAAGSAAARVELESSVRFQNAPEGFDSARNDITYGPVLGSPINSLSAADQTMRSLNTTPVVQSVAQQIAVTVKQASENEIEVSLSPAELGRVRMTLAAQDQALTIHVLTDRPETADLMRRHVEMLQQELRSLGYTSVKLDFEGGGAADDRHRGREENSGAVSDQPVLSEFESAAAPQPILIRTSGLDIRL